MLWVIAILIVVAIVILFAILSNLRIMNNHLQTNADRQNEVFGKLENIHADVRHKGTVTDPFKVANKTHTVAASSKHIIVRKSPDQIRNENYEEIKKGANYGQAE